MKIAKITMMINTTDATTAATTLGVVELEAIIAVSNLAFAAACGDYENVGGIA